jgi:GLPGLI family protein
MNIKKGFHFIIGVCLSALSYGQKKDSVLVIVHYSFVNVTDTTRPDQPFTQNMILYLGKNLSEFKSYDRVIEDSITKASTDEVARTNSINLRNRKKITATEYYKDVAINKLIIKQKLLTDYLMEDTIPSINWNIKPDIKTFSGIRCQRAVGKYRGRVYEAWFAPQFPYTNGPWKFGGLPGLILEIHDLKNEVIFSFNGMEVLAKHSLVIELPAEGTKTTAQEFEKITEAYRQNPVGFLNSTPTTNGITTKVSGPSYTPRNNRINNPIELPDK